MKFFVSFLNLLLSFLPKTMFAAITVAGTGGLGDVAVRQVYSKEVLFQALPNLKFMQFAKQKTDLNAAARGKGITFVRYANLSGSGSLTEGTDMPIETMIGSEVTIPVGEKGNSIQVTELLLQTSLLDTLADATRLLAGNYAVVLDKSFRDTLLTSTNIVFGRNKDGGAAPASALVMNNGQIFNTNVIKDAVEKLSLANAPKIAGEYYVCVASPRQLRQIRDDANWINAQAYRGTGRNLYLGEVGMYEGVIFIETTQMPFWGSSTGAAGTFVSKFPGTKTGSVTDVYGAVMFGDNAFGYAEALPVEIRDGGIQDVGRKHQIAWYSIFGTGIIEPNNVVAIYTAGV